MQESIYFPLRSAPRYRRHQRDRNMNGLECADVRELAIHRRLSRMNYTRRCVNYRVLKGAASHFIAKICIT